MQIFRTPPPVIFVLYSALIRNLIDQLFRIFPSQARVCYGPAVYPVLINLLAAFLQITLDHHAFHQRLQFRIVVPAVKHFTYDADLFAELFVGVGVVGVHNGGRIFQIPFLISFQQALQIFIVIVRNTGAVFVNTAS